MGQVLNRSATTTDAVRRTIHHSQESLRTLAKRHGINQKAVAKWRRRTAAADLPTDPREPKSTVLSIEDEAIIVAFRRHTLLALDDCLYALQATIPHLTRSSLHRCLRRNHISHLTDSTAFTNRLLSARVLQRSVGLPAIRGSMRCRRASVVSSRLTIGYLSPAIFETQAGLA